MRIVTRPDFDGVVCAALLYEALTITEPVFWVEPGDMQRGIVEVRDGDILANLPYDARCSMWFDHHYSNRIDSPVEGAFAIAPSAAGVVYNHYRDQLGPDFEELVHHTDRIDSADLTVAEVEHPEHYPYVLLSMTLTGQGDGDAEYWQHLTDLLRQPNMSRLMADPWVQDRCDQTRKENNAFRQLLLDHTQMADAVAVSDFRSLGTAPNGNRFLVYSLFPDAYVHMRIRTIPAESPRVAISVGHSIFNRQCRVNVGHMLSAFNGGGHKGAGACQVPMDEADEAIANIRDILKANQPNEDD